MPPKQAEAEKATLVAECTKHLREIGVPEENIDAWLRYKEATNAKTWRKIRDNLPTKEQIQEWTSMPKTLEVLNKIKSPLLAGWTVEEVIEAMGPFIASNVERYKTQRSEVGDYYQNGVTGVIKALRTDAGIAPFGNHAYLHTRTNIRRESVKSGVIKKTERKPSRTDVLLGITAWLCGLGVEQEMEKILQQEGYHSEYFGQTVKPHYEMADRKKLCKLAEKHGFVLLATRLWAKPNGKPISRQKMESVRKKARKKLMEARERLETGRLKLTENPGNPTCYFHGELRLFPLQRTGIRGAKAFLVSYSYKLDQLDILVQMELQEWLNRRYNHTLDLPEFWKGSRPDVLADSSYNTVADLVGSICSSPDFTGNPVPLDIKIRGEEVSLAGTIPDDQIGDPVEILQEQQSEKRILCLVRLARNRTKLTLEQKTVLVFLYGLDSEDKVAGSELAANFGQYILRMAYREGVEVDEKETRKRKVTRQRIMQYDLAIRAKLVESIFQVLVLAGHKEAVESRIEILSERAELSPEGQIALINHDSLESAVDLITIPRLSNQEKLILLREALQEAKIKVISYLLRSSF